jgi:hypothetical protein
MNRKYAQRLKRLEQKQSQALQAKKAWIPEWLSEIWSKDYGLPFDTEERGLDSLRQIQKRETVVTPVDDDRDIERLYALSFGEARRNATRGCSPAVNQLPLT